MYELHFYRRSVRLSALKTISSLDTFGHVDEIWKILDYAQKMAYFFSLSRDNHVLHWHVACALSETPGAIINIIAWCWRKQPV